MSTLLPPPLPHVWWYTYEKEAAQLGVKVAVFVVRHGCGFDLWPTKAKLPNGFQYKYSVAHSPYKNDLA